VDKPIQIGDLVLVLYPNHCGCGKAVGNIFRVAHIDTRPIRNRCGACNAIYGPEDQAGDGGNIRAQLWRLKRIPPLEELQGEKHHADISV
jgi:hypothetical protein